MAEQGREFDEQPREGPLVRLPLTETPAGETRTQHVTPQTISGQLDKMEEMGYVRKKRVGRESHYELREPLLRMVLEKKRG